MFLETTEVRWFWMTEDFPGAARWFAGHEIDLERDGERRTDEYLLLPRCRTAGVKIREGRLEIKTLISEEGRKLFPGGFPGKIQCWVKWSQGFGGTSEFPIERQEEWLEIEKIRLLRRFSLEGGILREIISGPSDASAVCHAELTRVASPRFKKTWATLGFEAISNGTPRIPVLNEAMEKFFRGQSDTPDEVRGAESLSYPEWLADITYF